MTPSISTPLIPHIKSGALRPIMVFTKNRLKEFPDVPTCMETGYPVAISGWWFGFMAPKGTPEEAVRTIAAACKKVIENHGNIIEGQLAKMSLNLDFAEPEEFAKDVKAENDALAPVIKDLVKTVK